MSMGPTLTAPSEPFISQVVHLRGFGIKIRNAL
jgi:hypothetical protein